MGQPFGRRPQWVNEVATQKSRKPEPTQAGYVLGVISALVGLF
jgi:hypothetical protein